MNYPKVKVRVLQSMNGFEPGDELMMLQGNLKYHAGKVEVIKEKEVKKEKKPTKKAIKNASNKAILTPKETK